MNQETVAVIGAGVAGLTAAYLLRHRYHVVLFDAQDRLGGHAHTHDLRAEGGRTVHVDSGFIVHNERTYPNLLRLFDELDVPTQDTEMSLSVRCEQCGLEYAGAKGAAGLFPHAGNLLRGKYLRMLGQVRRFHREANRTLAATEGEDDRTLGQFLADGGYSSYFVEHFALPVVSAVWSADRETSKLYPARYLFEFLRQHGMLSVSGSPTWRTVAGGSQEYVRRIGKQLPVLRTATPVRSVRRLAAGVEVRDAADSVHYADRAVLATHADETLAMLAEPSSVERAVLGSFRYSRNETWLHTDPALLPATPGTRASWNYLKPRCSSGPDRVLVSYDMNRLMRLAEPQDYVVTLGATDRIRDDRVLARMDYHHPIYTPESVAAQRRLPELGDRRLQFAGAYHGWGFHEDGCASGVRAAKAFGAEWPA